MFLEVITSLKHKFLKNMIPIKIEKKKRLWHAAVLYYCIYSSSIKRNYNKLRLNIHLKNPNYTR